jgi:hypothetical protein
MVAAPVQCDVDGIPKGSHYVLVKRANLLLDGNFFSKPGIFKETFSKRAIHPIFIIVPGCALKLGNQRKQNTAIGRLEAGRRQVRENYLVLMNLSRLGDRPIYVMWA